MYIVAIHDIQSEAAFERGQALIQGEGAPEDARVLQFYPGADGSRVVCLWEGASTDTLQQYVDQVLGDSSVNTVFAVDAEQAFAERPLGLQSAPQPVG